MIVSHSLHKILQRPEMLEKSGYLRNANLIIIIFLQNQCMLAAHAFKAIALGAK